jgi:hypothetical protein
MQNTSGLSATSATPDVARAPALRPGLMAVQGLAACAGIFFGYGFGDRIGGPAVGALAALNSAVFGVLMVSGLDDLIARVRQGHRREPARPR